MKKTRTGTGVVISINKSGLIVECGDGKTGTVAAGEPDRAGACSRFNIGDCIDFIYTGRMQNGKHVLKLAFPEQGQELMSGPGDVSYRYYRKFGSGSRRFTYAYARPERIRPLRSGAHVEKGSVAAEYIGAAVNATGLSWGYYYGLLIRTAKELGLMPEDRRCIEKMLETAGFFHMPGKRSIRSSDDLISYMDETFRDGRTAIFMTSRADSSCAAAIVPTRGVSDYALCDHWDLNWEKIGKIWVRWPDGEYHGKDSVENSVRDSDGKRGREEKSVRFPDLFGNRGDINNAGTDSRWTYYQPNPGENRIGDCAVRALSAVCGISWEAALDKLAEAAEGDPKINSARVIKRCLAGSGFRKGYDVKDSHMSAYEFCDYLTRTYRKGERVYAFEPGHAAAFIPDSNGTYRVWDNWNSEYRVVDFYFVSDAAAS